MISHTSLVIRITKNCFHTISIFKHEDRNSRVILFYGQRSKLDDQYIRIVRMKLANLAEIVLLYISNKSNYKNTLNVNIKTGQRGSFNKFGCITFYELMWISSSLQPVLWKQLCFLVHTIITNSRMFVLTNLMLKYNINKWRNNIKYVYVFRYLNARQN